MNDKKDNILKPDFPNHKKEKKPKKYFILFDVRAQELLEELEEKTGLSQAQVLAESLAMFHFIYRHYKKGRVLAAIRNGKIKEEIIIPLFEKMLDKQ